MDQGGQGRRGSGACGSEVEGFASPLVHGRTAAHPRIIGTRDGELRFPRRFGDLSPWNDLRRDLGVKYHLRRQPLLKELGWTPQKPIRRAKQRKEAEIQRWKTERWPELKKRWSKKDERSSS